MATQHTITSLSGFIKKLELFSESKPDDWRHSRFDFLFRGQSNSAYELLPTIARGGTKDQWDSLLNYEEDLIAAAKHRFPDLFRDSLSPIDTLALMQHYGVPTRLLDVSENPLAALYFACTGNKGADGEVIVFAFHGANAVSYPISEALADSCNLVRGNETKLYDFYDRMMEQPYFRYQRLWLKEEIKDPMSKDAWIRDCCNQIIHVQASFNSQRQNAQLGRFILFANHIDMSSADGSYVFQNRILPIDKNSEGVFARITIPAHSKQKIINSLRAVGITAGSLFPDDLDKVCHSVVEKTAGDSNAYKRLYK